MTRVKLPVALLALCGLVGAGPSSAFAQGWSGDARRIAMGGAGTSENLATKMVEDEGGHFTIPLPFGLFQILKNRDIFNPDSDEFDLVRSIEYAASPLHFVANRDGTGTGVTLVNDLTDGRLSRDLNAYRGFVPVTQPVAYGLASPNWGGTIPVYRSGTTRHGIYVGAGPYLSVRGELNVNEQLVDIWSSSANVYLPNATFPVTSSLTGQAALAIIGGYRGRFGLAGTGTGSPRDGVYLAVNYNYLMGYRYEEADIDLRLDTDGAGLVTLNPSLPPPILAVRENSTSGRGMAVDAGVAVVVGPWEFGGGVNGIGNHIDWKEVERTTYTLTNILSGDGDFTESLPLPVGDTRVELPVEYLGNVGYRAEQWTALVEVGQKVSNDPRDEGRLAATVVRTGFEYRFAVLAPRVGAFYSRERWQPSAGVGLNFGAFGVDLAAFWTDANVRRERHAAFAASLRIGTRPR